MRRLVSLRAISIAPTLLTLLLAAAAVAAEPAPDASELLRQVRAMYGSMQSYTSSGEVTTAIRPAGMPAQELTHSFTVKLARPQLYDVRWQQTMPGFVMSGAIWSAGDGHFVSIPGQAAPESVKDLSTAVAMGTGISGGATNTIPGAFFGLDFGLFSTTSGATVVREESIEGDPCFVVSANESTQPLELWISKESKLVRRIRRELGGMGAMPEMSDADARESLKAMHRETTDEAVAALEAQMEHARSMVAGMTGFSLETHRDIHVDAPLGRADFAHPEATTGN